MNANITKAVNFTFGIPKKDKVLSQHHFFNWFISYVFAFISHIPKIDKHYIPLKVNTAKL